MVEELQTWFAWQGVPTLDIGVQVRERATPPSGWLLSASHNNVQAGPDNLQQAIDGNPSTRWSTFGRQTPGMWFQVDLQEIKTIARVSLDNNASPLDYPRGYHIHLSTDGRTWTTVAEKPTNDRPVKATFSPRSARYVRLEQTGNTDGWWWSIHELTIDDAVKPTVRSSHSNVLTGSDNLGNALDGDPNTRWSTLFPQRAGMWFEIDLQQTQFVRGLRLDGAGSASDYPRGYVIRLSVEGQQWVEVARNASNTQAVNETFPEHLARYIHIEQTGWSLRWWWSIHEIEVTAREANLSATASHNNVISGADNLWQAFDDQANTRWSSGASQTPGMWFEIDLNEARVVSGLYLDITGSPHDYPRGYVLRVSQDRYLWHEVARAPDNNQPLNVNFNPRLVRYFRLELTREYEYWLSVHEINVKE